MYGIVDVKIFYHYEYANSAMHRFGWRNLDIIMKKDAVRGILALFPHMLVSLALWKKVR